MDAVLRDDARAYQFRELTRRFRSGTGTEPQINLDGILEAVRRSTDSDVRTWDDIDRIDVRPGRGVAKVRLNDGWEIQVDLGTGEVLQSAYRRSDLIESVHDGSLFGGDIVKLGVFLPTGIILFAMWVSGMWMFWVPFSARRAKRKKRRSDAQSSSGRAVKLPPPRGRRKLP